MSGVLQGLFRVRVVHPGRRSHLLPARAGGRRGASGVIDLVRRMYQTFGFERVHVELSTRPEKSIGSDEMWADRREGAWRPPWSGPELAYTLNPGDGAFYGPKIDFHIEDVMGRTWQCATCQLDFAMPERLDLEYIGEDNQRHRPVMLHRTVFGSIERFLGILIEQYGGALPGLAGAGAGADRARRRPSRAVRRAGRAAALLAARACGSRPTCAPSRCRRRSATARSRRCRSCWWSATARSSRRR